MKRELVQACQRAMARKDYDALPPFGRGYVMQMQSGWNPEIPKKCPYKRGTKQWEQFAFGAGYAVLLAQEVDE